MSRDDQRAKSSSGAGDNEHSRSARMARGKLLRQTVARSDHRVWKPEADRPDPVTLIEATNAGRLAEFIPIRHGRMVQSAFAFLRGSAVVMAADLSRTPVTGIRAQVCGDCHLLNFGTFIGPDGNMLFDINDFDESLPAPWEWDIKRLTASFVVAARHIGLSDHNARDASRACVRSYRERMCEFAEMRVLDVWNTRHEVGEFISQYSKKKGDSLQGDDLGIATIDPRHVADTIPKLAEKVKGKWKIADKPPLIFHPNQAQGFANEVPQFLRLYLQSLQEDRRALLERYRLADWALKVVGVGSVGLRCAVALFEAGEDDPLVLQFKEARPSVLEPYVGKSAYSNHGQRVVTGQRMMQSVSDNFLGWSRAEAHGLDFYFRQLRGLKGSITPEKMSAARLIEYAKICGWVLSRSHAKTSDAAMISGYLGQGDAFDQALADFAIAYADQTEQDYDAFKQAVASGRIAAVSESSGD